MPLNKAMKAMPVAAAAIAIVCFDPGRLSSHETVNTTVTYDREIVRILKKKCVVCHTADNLGMPLTSYEETRPWARSIEDEALRRHMPPWRAVSGYGEFANDIALTSRELQFLVAWVEGNGPKTKDERMIVNISAPTPPSERLHVDFTKWALGAPDTVQPFELASAGTSAATRRTAIALPFTSSRWVRALAFQPADRRFVTAVSFVVQETGQWLGTWTPWFTATVVPAGTAYLVPPRAHIVAEAHYRNGQAPAIDRGTLGLYFSAGPPKNTLKDLVLASRPDGPDPAQRPLRFSASLTLAGDASVLALNPEVNAGLQSIEVRARTPDGAVTVLLLVRDPLDDWPTAYALKQPLPLPKGAEITTTSYWSAAVEPPADLKTTITIAVPNGRD